MDLARLIATALVIVAVVGLVAVKSVNNAFEIDRSYSYRPSSPAEADAYGVLEQTFPFSGSQRGDTLGSVYEGRGWVYSESHVEYRWLLQRRLVREDKLHLCFTLNSPSAELRGRLRSNRVTWRVDDGEFFRSEGLDRKMVFCRPTDSTVRDTLRATLVTRDSLEATM